MSKKNRNNWFIASLLGGLLFIGFFYRLYGLDANHAFWNDEEQVAVFVRSIIERSKPVLVNDYTNAWYIIWEDAGGVEDYELIIEFRPQRLLYIGLGISLAIFLGCLGYLGFSFVKNT